MGDLLFWWIIFLDRRRFCKYFFEILFIRFKILFIRVYCGRIFWGIGYDIFDLCIILWKMDINLWLLFSIDNGFEKVFKRVKFRYLYFVKVRNYGIYVWNGFYFVWNRFYFERFEKVLFCWKVLYICCFLMYFFRERFCFFFFFWMVNIF